MKLYYDFHIHSALSPCSDSDMTPNNIINMATLKGLDAIAICDHNSYHNLKAFIEVSKNKDLIVIPGIEVETAEEVHLICLFESLKNASFFGEEIYNSIPNIKNNPKIFGSQVILNENDEACGNLEKLLISACSFSIENVIKLVKKYNGVVIPSHIDRQSNSIISNLGFISDDFSFSYVEISNKCNYNEFINKYNYLKNYNIIKNSDAHTLSEISEKINFIEVQEKNIKSILNIFRQK